jgi:hypothetical protein
MNHKLSAIFITAFFALNAGAIETGAGATSPECAGSTNWQTIIQGEEFIVPSDQAMILTENTAIIADAVNIQGGLIGSQSEETGEAIDICIKTNSLSISGLLCTAPGQSGGPNISAITNESLTAANGKNGGDIYLQLPLTGITVPSGIICTGDGGNGQNIIATTPSMVNGSNPATCQITEGIQTISGGTGGNAGEFIIYSGQSELQSAISLGDGGKGGSAQAVSSISQIYALGGSGGNSGEMYASGAPLPKTSLGGSGGDAFSSGCAPEILMQANMRIDASCLTEKDKCVGGELPEDPCDLLVADCQDPPTSEELMEEICSLRFERRGTTLIFCEENGINLQQLYQQLRNLINEPLPGPCDELPLSCALPCDIYGDDIVDRATCLVIMVIDECYRPITPPPKDESICGRIDDMGYGDIRGKPGMAHISHGDTGPAGDRGYEGSSSGWSISTGAGVGFGSDGGVGVSASFSCSMTASERGGNAQYRDLSGGSATATGGEGGEGYLQGGEGGSAKATGGKGGIGGAGGKGGDGLVGFCLIAYAESGAGGGHGGQGGKGGAATATGGPGGDSAVLGGAGGNAEADYSPGGAGGNGGAGGIVKIDVSCLYSLTLCAIAYATVSNGNAGCPGPGGWSGDPAATGGTGGEGILLDDGPDGKATFPDKAVQAPAGVGSNC